MSSSSTLSPVLASPFSPDLCPRLLHDERERDVDFCWLHFQQEELTTAGGAAVIRDLLPFAFLRWRCRVQFWRAFAAHVKCFHLLLQLLLLLLLAMQSRGKWNQLFSIVSHLLSDCICCLTAYAYRRRYQVEWVSPLYLPLLALPRRPSVLERWPNCRRQWPKRRWVECNFDTGRRRRRFLPTSYGINSCSAHRSEPDSVRINACNSITSSSHHQSRRLYIG